MAEALTGTLDDMSIGYDWEITYNYKDLPPENSSPASFNILYMNPNGIATKGKIDEIKCILAMIPKTVHLIVITEARITEKTNLNAITLPKYNLYCTRRESVKGGGVAMYIRSNLISDADTYNDAYTNTNGTSFLWVHLNKPQLTIGIVYYPGNSGTKYEASPEKGTNNDDAFITECSEILKYRTNGKERAVVFGDFNFNLLNDQNSKYINMFTEKDFVILNKINDEKYFTRFGTNKNRKHTFSVLDHVWSKLKGAEYYLALIDSPLSDHRVQYVEIRESKLALEVESKPKLENKRESWITDDILSKIKSRNELYSTYLSTLVNEVKKQYDKYSEAHNEVLELRKNSKKIKKPTVGEDAYRAGTSSSEINDEEYYDDYDDPCDFDDSELILQLSDKKLEKNYF